MIPLNSYNDLLIFAADDGEAGRELWVCRGGEARLVADIRSGGSGSNPADLTAVGSVILFTADDGEHGRELWRTDGTADGTSLVADILPGSALAWVDPVTTDPSKTPANGQPFSIQNNNVGADNSGCCNRSS